MIVTVSGMMGAGNSTAARKLAEHLGFPLYSAGDMRRNAAKDRGLSLHDYNALDEDTDTDVEKYQQKLAEEQDNFVMDAKMGAWAIPKAINIFLTAEEDTRMQRIITKDSEHERVGEDPHSVEEARELMKQRIASDRSRYKEHYGFDPYDANNYEFVIDTTHLSKEEVVAKLIEIVESQS